MVEWQGLHSLDKKGILNFYRASPKIFGHIYLLMSDILYMYYAYYLGPIFAEIPKTKYKYLPQNRTFSMELPLLY